MGVSTCEGWRQGCSGPPLLWRRGKPAGLARAKPAACQRQQSQRRRPGRKLWAGLPRQAGVWRRGRPTPATHLHKAVLVLQKAPDGPHQSVAHAQVLGHARSPAGQAAESRAPQTGLGVRRGGQLLLERRAAAQALSSPSQCSLQRPPSPLFRGESPTSGPAPCASGAAPRAAPPRPPPRSRKRAACG